MRPAPSEAAPYYFNYIDRVESDDVVQVLTTQLDEAVAFLGSVSEEKSLHRYAPDKWSLRQLLNHINDTERLFVFRALWFARGFEEPLPSFDQNVAVSGSGADAVSWSDLVKEFRSIRQSTIAFFQSLPDGAWDKAGIASDNRFTVRALAYIAAGHVTHHIDVISAHYL